MYTAAADMRRVDEDYQAAWVDEEDDDNEEEEEFSDSDDDDDDDAAMVNINLSISRCIFSSCRFLLLTWIVKVLL